MTHYVFEETGEGCAEHSDPACLCDVTPIPGGVPIVKLPDYAEYPSSGGYGANSFIVWASMTLGRFEALAGINETELNEALAVWENREGCRGDRQAGNRIAAVKQCVKAGLTFEQTARWLSAPLVDVMDLLYPRERHSLILEMEKLMRAGKSSREVAKVTGCDPRYATALASRWGIKLPHSGRRITDAEREEARKLVKSGMSRRAAAKALGMSETCVTLACKGLPNKPKFGNRPKGTK